MMKSLVDNACSKISVTINISKYKSSNFLSLRNDFLVLQNTTELVRREEENERDRDHEGCVV